LLVHLEDQNYLFVGQLLELRKVSSKALNILLPCEVLLLFEIVQVQHRLFTFETLILFWLREQVCSRLVYIILESSRRVIVI
jgi:hypothetical protein